jgi:hypothetical protein
VYEAKIILDSVSPRGHRLTTFCVTFPRFILSEVNTHGVISKNSASSRAIPFKKQLEKVLTDPFVPERFYRNQSGMQAREELPEPEQQKARDAWIDGRDQAVDIARRLNDVGVHKQWTNRPLEPYMWHTALLTATEWENFFNLRAHGDAQPEFGVIATMMRTLYDNHTPRKVDYGEWHLPLVTGYEDEPLQEADYWPDVSTGRCARVSYLTHEGKRDLDADIELTCDKLQPAGHMSPFQHPALCVEDDDMHGNYRGWLPYRKMIPGEAVFRPKDSVA